jgi:hypothetical protein
MATARIRQIAPLIREIGVRISHELGHDQPAAVSDKQAAPARVVSVQRMNAASRRRVTV